MLVDYKRRSFMDIKRVFIFSLILCSLNVQMMWSYSRAMENSECAVAMASPLDAVFGFMASILDKSDIQMGVIHRNIHEAINRWKRKQVVNNVTVKTILQFAHFLGTHPSTLLKLGYTQDFTPSRQIRKRDILQALNSGQPLSIDMLKYLESRETLPDEYIHYLENRPHLSNEAFNQLSNYMNSVLKEKILQYALSYSPRGQMGLPRLSQEIGISSTLMRRIVYRYHLPSFNFLEQILKAIGTDLIAFFEALESSQEFQILLRSVQIGRNQRELNSRQRAKVKFMGDRIQRAMHLRNMGLSVDLSRLTGLNRRLLEYAERDIALSSMVHTSFASEIPLSVLVDDEESLENYTRKHIHSGRLTDEIRAEKVSGDYMMKFRKAFTRFIRYKLNKQNISLSELSRQSYLQVDTLIGIVINGVAPNYLTLLKIVENGFREDLKSFFQEFERYVEASQTSLDFETTTPYLRFEHALRADDDDSHQVVELRRELADHHSSYRSVTLEETVISLYERLLEAVRLTSLPAYTIYRITGIVIERWKANIPRSKIKSIIKLAHFFRITPFQLLLGSEPLSELINSANFTNAMLSRYTPPSNQELQASIEHLSTNIQRQKDYHHISDQDLQIRLAIFNIRELNPILYGGPSVTLLRLFQVTEALAWSVSPAPDDAQMNVIYTPPSNEEFGKMLEMILDGVGISR